MAIIKLAIRSVKLPSKKTLKSVDYQISTDGQFTDKDFIVNIQKDKKYLTGREFDLDFTVQDIYYGRVRLNFNEEGEKEDYYQGRPVIITRSGDGFSHNNAVIVTPSLSIDCDVNNSELGGFNVTASDFILFSGVGDHKCTNWFVRDTNGTVKWQREQDDANLTSIRIPNDVLDGNRHYTIEAVYISTGNQRSNIGKLIIKTMGKSRHASTVDYGDVRTSSKEMKELQEGYDELLEVIVNAKALGIHHFDTINRGDI